MNSENMNIYEKIEKFTELSQEDLLSLKDELCLDISLDGLTECQNYHKLSEDKLSLEKLKIYDSLYPDPEPAENVAIGQIRSQSKVLMNTIADLYSKAKALNMTNNSSISLKDIVLVSGKYFERIGITPVPVCSDVQEAKSSAPIAENTAFIILQRNDKTEGSYEKLKTNSFFLDNVIVDFPVSEKGILKTLSAMSSGLFLDTDVLYKDNGEDYLSELTEPIKNSFIAALPQSSVEGFISLAASYDLDAKYFAKSLAQDQIVIRHNGQNTVLTIPFKRAASAEKIALTLSEHDYSHNDYTRFSSYKEASEANSLQTLTTVGSGFFEAMDIVIDSINSLTAMGIDRRNMALSLSFAIPSQNELSNEEKLGAPLASALGAYRAMVELAVGDINSSLSYSKDDFVSCAAYSNTRPIDIKDKFSNEGSGVYFVGLKRPELINNDYLPDFALLRKISDKVSLLIREGKAFSVKVFNGKISDALSEMENEGLTVIREDNNTIYDSYGQGFIIESNLEISSIKLGNLVKGIDETL